MTKNEIKILKSLDFSENKCALNLVLNDYKKIKDKKYHFFDFLNYKEFILDYNTYYNGEPISSDNIISYSYNIYNNKLAKDKNVKKPNYIIDDSEIFRIDAIYDLFKCGFVTKQNFELYYSYIYKIFTDLSYIIKYNNELYFYTLKENEILNSNKDIIYVRDLDKNLNNIIAKLNNKIEKIVKCDNIYFINKAEE